MSIETPTQSKVASKRFVLLDSLRGYAAFAIMILHFPEINGTLNTYLAVDFFLILSGFVLMHAYFRNPGFSFISFAQARFARLYPLHLITLIVSVLIYVVTSEYIDKSTLALHGLMIHHVGLGPDKFWFNSPSWSISVEFWVNILVALALVFGTRILGSIKSSIVNGLMIAVSIACYATLFMTLGHLDGHIQTLAPAISAGMIRGMASFLAGILIYKLYTHLDAAPNPALQRAFGLATPILLALFAICLWLPYIHLWIDFLMLPLFLAVVLIGAFEVGSSAKLAMKIHHLGTISFSLYLIHRPIQKIAYLILPEGTPLAVKIILIVPVVLVLAHLTQKYFEMPVYRRLKKLLRDAPLFVSKWSTRSARE